MSKLSWRKFDMQHWLSDPCLRLCSRRARGLWMDMLCIMHDCDPVGHLLVRNRPMTVRDLSSILGENVDQIERDWCELGRNLVYDLLPNGTVICRKMVRDHARDEANRKNGKGGGNPTLTGKVSPKKEGKILYYPRRFVDTSSVNPPVQPPSEKWVKAESESEKEKEKESAPQGSALGGPPLGAGMVAQALRRQPHIQEPLRSPAEQLAALGFTPDGKKMR